MPLFRALAKNMAPMTNADESPTNRLTLFPIYLSLFVVSTLCPRSQTIKTIDFKRNCAEHEYMNMPPPHYQVYYATEPRQCS